MSRLLKNKKRVAFLVLVVLVIVAVTMVGIALNFNPIYYAFVYLLFILVALLTYAVRNKMSKMSAPFGTFSGIRNVDYLIIGDFCRAEDYVPKGATYVQIAAPGRGLNSSFQILRHTHSILKEEEGNVIIALGNNKKDFLIFDMPFLHSITIKKFHLERLKK